MGMESIRREGFEAVYKEYRDLIFQTINMYIQHPEDAEDLTQEVFIRYYIHSARSKPDNPKCWLMVVAKNLACDYIRHSRFERLLTEEESMEQLLEKAPDVEDAFFDNMWKLDILEYTERIFEGVSAKNRKWYDAMIYSYCMKMPRQEIAECMGITLDAVMGMLKRTKKWIKDNYKEEYDYIIGA